MVRGLVLLVALASCREIYGLDDPDPVPLDAYVLVNPGLREHVLPNMSFWTFDETPDASWAHTTGMGLDPAITVWTGSGPSVAELETEGVNIDVPFSVWFDGQIYVTTDLNLQLIADDFAFVDISTRGTYMRLLESDHKAVTRTLAGFAEGWYPVRIGWSQTGGSEAFLFQQRTPEDGAAFRDWSVTQLRYPPAM
jgi:hypothetical protein